MRNTFSYMRKMFVVIISSYIIRNKYSYYTFSCITEIFICYYISSYIITNKYCHYTSSCIMRNTLSCMIEMFVVIIYLLI